MSLHKKPCICSWLWTCDICCVVVFQGGQVWLKDKEASHCKLCEKEFSISRRKVSCQITNRQKKRKNPTWIVVLTVSLSLSVQHHCRNCGEIFCNSCSDNELPLPASPKPVRVCDTCHALLLQRCSSNPTWRSPALLPRPLQAIWAQPHKSPPSKLISTVFAARNGPHAWTFF